MKKYNIRFNKTRGQEGRGTIDHVWRVFEGDKEYLFKNLDINVPVKSELDVNGIDYNITCEGTLKINKETSTAVIVSASPPPALVALDATHIHNLFPTPVGIFKLNRALSETELSYLQSLETKSNVGNSSSKSSLVLENKKLFGIRKFVDTSLDTYFQTVYNPKNDVSIHMTQSWVNYTKPGQFHHKHAHPNSFVSGVFYAQVKDTDQISFFREVYNTFDIASKEYGTYNSNRSQINVEDGMLLLFPSSLVHMVNPVQGAHTRISIAFNTFPKGEIGDANSMMGLTL